MAGKTVIEVPELRDRTESDAFQNCIRVGDWVFVAGMGGTDENGPVSPEFEPQVRKAFEKIEYATEAAGGSLSDLVHMTVYVTDWRYGDEFTDLRGEILGEDLTTSALVGVDSLAWPGMLVEIEAKAFVPEE